MTHQGHPRPHPAHQGMHGQQPNPILAMMQGLSAQTKALQEMVQKLGSASDFPPPGTSWPAQQKAGVIEHPDKKLFPFMFGYEELRENGTPNGATYASSLTEASCTIQTNDIDTYIEGVAFRLRRTSAPEGSPLPVGTFLPLGCKYHPFVANGDLYVGKDFVWTIQTTQLGLSLQGEGSTDRASSDCDENGVFWFKNELRMTTRDSFRIGATPLVGPVVDDAYILEAALIGYQMRYAPK